MYRRGLLQRLEGPEDLELGIRGEVPEGTTKRGSGAEPPG